ncbi:MAG: polysaccharide pyruvyl transferase family protein [Gemmataceae bacterium]
MRCGSDFVIAIKGYFGFSNFGDDAMMAVLGGLLRRVAPEARLVFVCEENSYVRRLVPNADIVQRSREAEIAPDLLLYGGGTQFFSFPLTTSRGQSKAVRRLRLSLRPHLAVRAMLGRYHRPKPHIAALGIGLGPFLGDPRERQATLDLFRRMEFVSVRDPDSLRLCQEWGVKSAYYHTDLCYLPGSWEAARRVNRGTVSRIGVIVRDWPHTIEGDSHREPLLEAVGELRRLGKQVTFVLFTHGRDRVWSERLRERSEAVVEWQPERSSISAFVESLTQFDLLVTSRFHGAVFGSLIGIPVVCIGIEPKLEFASRLLGAGARLWQHPFPPRQCVAAVLDLESSYFVATEALITVVREQRACVDAEVRDFARYLSDCFQVGAGL